MLSAPERGLGHRRHRHVAHQRSRTPGGSLLPPPAPGSYLIATDASGTWCALPESHDSVPGPARHASVLGAGTTHASVRDTSLVGTYKLFIVSVRTG